MLTAESAVTRSARNLLFGRPECRRPPARILVLRTARLGDFVVAIPAFALLRRLFPTATIHLLTATTTNRQDHSSTSVYAGSEEPPWASLIVPNVINGVSAFRPFPFAAAIDDARVAVQSTDPDTTFLFPYTGESLTSRLRKLLFLRLAGVRKQVFGVDVTTDLSRFRRLQHELGLCEHQVVTPIRAIVESGWTEQRLEPEISFPIALPSSAEIWAAQTLEAAHSHGGPLVAVFPGGLAAEKRWPAESYRQVCRDIAQRTEAHFIMIGTASDQPYSDIARRGLSENRVLDLTGRTTLLQLAAVLRCCDVYFGNDSGPGHLAAGLDCHCVIPMSGLEFHEIWRPWPASRHAILTNETECYGCARVPCRKGTLACIVDIAPDRILNVCLGLLQSLSAPRRNRSDSQQLTTPESNAPK
jgi:ADP-heptose:LPS heptosyltransferase